MFSRHLSAVAVSIAMVAAPMGGAIAFAQTPPAATAQSLQGVISTAARTAAAQSGFQTMAADTKTSAIVAAVSGALSLSGASPDVMADALIQAVADGTISAGVAISVAASVAPDMAAKVAAAKVVKDQLSKTGQTATVTASTDGAGGVSVLVGLGGADAGGGQTAAYDACAGVIAAYCGS